VSRGLSTRQRKALALLVASKRSLDVTNDLLPMLGEETTDSSRRSMLRAMRLLRDRGLVTLERVPSDRGGHPRVLVAARPHARGELKGGELQRARNDGAPSRAREDHASPAKGTVTPRRQPRPSTPTTHSGPTCLRCDRPATLIVWGMAPNAEPGKPNKHGIRPVPPAKYCEVHALEYAEHLNAGGCSECERKATHSLAMAFTTAGLSPERIVRNHPKDPSSRYCLPCAKKALARRKAREH
jgi:hypothetical protein